MALLSFQDFWSDIVRCTTNGSFSSSVKFELGGETKISNFDFHLIVEEQVTKLEISMNDSMRMQVFDSVTDHDNVALNLQLVESLSSSKELVQGLTLA